MTQEQQPSPPEEAVAASSPARGIALLITNLIKLGGLVVALHEALFGEQNAAVLGLAAFMMAGATGVETALDRLLGK